MTWAERVGDLATNVVLVLINFLRIFTLIVRIAAEKIDGFVINLAERSEGGIRSTGTGASTWIALPASVAWGIAAVILRALSVITVFIRQITTTLDEFLEALTAETDGGVGRPTPPPVDQPVTPSSMSNA
jgi:hypothetical protein